MDNLAIDSARYTLDFEGQLNSISIVVNGITKAVPLDPANIVYAEVMRQVEEGTLTIQDAE